MMEADPWPEWAKVTWLTGWWVTFNQLAWIQKFTYAIMFNRPYISVPFDYEGKQIDCIQGTKISFYRTGKILAEFELINDEWVESE